MGRPAISDRIKEGVKQFKEMFPDKCNLEIGKKFGISHSSVARILAGNRREHRERLDIGRRLHDRELSALIKRQSQERVDYDKAWAAGIQSMKERHRQEVIELESNYAFLRG